MKLHVEGRTIQVPVWPIALIVALGLVTITLANRIVLAIVMTPLAPLGLTMMQLGGTVLIYPLVVFVAHYLLGVAYAAPGDMRKIGQRT